MNVILELKMIKECKYYSLKLKLVIQYDQMANSNLFNKLL